MYQICYTKDRVLKGPESWGEDIWIVELMNISVPDLSEKSGPVEMAQYSVEG